MAKFTIYAACINYVSAEVEAKDFDEAKRIYEDMDGAEFHDDGLGDWRLDYIMREDGEIIEY